MVAQLEPLSVCEGASQAALLESPSVCEGASESARHQEPDNPVDTKLHAPWGEAFASLMKGKTGPTRIPEVEFRGIMPGQLKEVLIFIWDRCSPDEYSDGSFHPLCQSGVIQAWTDRQGQHVNFQDMNLYELVEWLIFPLTAPCRCSFVEAIAVIAVKQRPSWFVSHWWGEPVVHFVKCLCEHISIRGLDPETAYWVCAYANNQHELGSDLGIDPMESSFLKAMEISTGVLLILDSVGPGTPFKRIWCCFEEGVVALVGRGFLKAEGDMRKVLGRLVARDGKEGRKQGLKFDIASLDDCKMPRILTDGLADNERQSQEKLETTGSGSNGYGMKRRREAHFPMEQIRSGLHINIQISSASHEIDKVRILNTLAGRPIAELDLQAASEHPTYDVVNQMLRSTFALAALPSIMGQNKQEPLRELLMALSADISRPHLVLHLSSLRVSVESFELFASSLSPLVNLKSLSLHLEEWPSTLPWDLLWQSLSKLSALKVLKLELARSKLVSLSPLGIALQDLNQLVDLDLGCACNRGLSLTGFASLKRLSLRHLRLNLFGCETLMDSVEFFEGLAAQRSLETLDLNLGDCKEFPAGHSGRFLVDLGKSFGEMTELRTLTLNIWAARKLRDLDGFEALAANTKLVRLDLKCDGLIFLHSWSGLAQGLRGLDSLQQLLINFEDNGDLVSAKEDELAAALAGLKLRTLDLNLKKIPFQSIAFLVKALTLTGMQEFSLCVAASRIVDLAGFELLPRSLQTVLLDVSSCLELRSICHLAQGLRGIQGLKQLQLSFRGCSALDSLSDLAESLQPTVKLELDTCWSKLPEALQTVFEDVAELRAVASA